MQSSQLERQKKAILSLMDELTSELPLTVQTLIQMNRSTVCHLVDNLSGEQINDLLSRARDILDRIESGESDETNSDTD